MLPVIRINLFSRKKFMEFPEHHERRQYNFQMAEDIGAIKAMIEGLSGPTGRVTKIEEGLDRAETRTWIHTAVVLPLVGAAHVIVHKLGL